MLRKGHIETGARTSCAHSEDTQKIHLGQLSSYKLLYRMNATQTWTAASAELVDIWAWNDSTVWTWQSSRRTSSHGYSAWGTTPACHAAWDVPVPMNPAALLPTLHRPFARGTHGSMLESFWGQEKMLKNLKQFWNSVSDLDNCLASASIGKAAINPDQVRLHWRRVPACCLMKWLCVQICQYITKYPRGTDK